MNPEVSLLDARGRRQTLFTTWYIFHVYYSDFFPCFFWFLWWKCYPR